MDSESILGGVTPLKARKSAGKAGKVGKKATATRAQDKSGFSRSDTVDTGKGYKANLESLTAGTRVTSSLADALGAKGPGGQPTKKGGGDFGKTDDFDDIFTTEQKQDPDKKIKEERKLESYPGFWVKRIDDPDNWSPGMKRYLKDVDLDDNDALQAAYDGWKAESIRGKEQRDAEYETSYKTVSGQKYERKLKNSKPITSGSTDAEGWYKVN
tara:strand:+ start:1975 stop:2613 length:639 start_codon:yes stop_codon:yes gene_type:complete